MVCQQNFDLINLRWFQPDCSSSGKYGKLPDVILFLWYLCSKLKWTRQFLSFSRCLFNHSNPYFRRMLAVSLSRSNISSIISSGARGASSGYWVLYRQIIRRVVNITSLNNSSLQLQIYSAPLKSLISRCHSVDRFCPGFGLDVVGSTKFVWLGCLS